MQKRLSPTLSRKIVKKIRNRAIKNQLTDNAVSSGSICGPLI